MTRAVAFFRNVNLGRPPSPSRPMLEQAFVDAGADSAVSFLTNGTVVFDAAEAEAVVAAACGLLSRRCGLAEPAFVRTMRALERLVAVDRFATVRAEVHECVVTFLSPRARFPATAPRVTPRGDVEVLGFTTSEVFSVTRVVGRSPGSPNAFLEKALARPATTRNWNTVNRLVSKFSALPGRAAQRNR